MDWRASCAIVIPCFNESRQIHSVVHSVRAYLPHVLVVDDGSSDSTAERAVSSGATVVWHDQNRGKGAALATGLAAALHQGFLWALTMDGDGQHAAGDIAKFLRCADSTGATLVIGNRMSRAELMPWLRRRVNRWMSRRISAHVGQFLPDTQCGFRLINLAVWRTLKLKASRFEVESELLAAFVRARQRIEFVPVEVIYNGEQSKIHPIADTFRWFAWWCRSRRRGGSVEG